MTGRQGHDGDLTWIPGVDHVAARVRVVLQRVDEPLDLVHAAKVAPLLAVDRSQFAVCIGPFVPDAHPVFLQIAHVGIATQEPEQFMDDAAQVQLFGSDERKTFAEVEAHLVAENAERSRSSPVGFANAVIKDVLEVVEVNVHRGWCLDVGGHTS